MTAYINKRADSVTASMFSRKVLADLREWRRSSARKPLIIRGARQVGKSSVVRLFAQEYGRYAELNLEKRDHANLFRRGLSTLDLVQAIKLECGIKSGDEQLLIFIDEIQEVPEAIAMLRFLCEERPDLHVIAAGSLLEAALDADAISFPVGRVQFLYLRPLTFAEFLGALGDNAAIEAWNMVPAPVFAHSRLISLFNTYALLGGMPEAVRRYRDTKGDLAEVNRVYSDLLTAFRDDIPKYGRNETMRRIILHCLETAPYSAGSRVTFHGFGGSNYRSREVGEALRTLERVMLLSLVYPTVQLKSPLMPDRKKSPRLHFLDVGLVNYISGMQKQLLGIHDLTELHRGRLIEQVVGQELLAKESRSEVPLVFWVRDKAQSQAEIDYLLNTDDGVVPVEVKSGATGKLRSLHEFMGRSRAGTAVRLYAGEYSVQDVVSGGASYRLINIPYYAAARIEETIDTEG